MNELNRVLIVLGAAVWIVAMAVIIFITWAAPEEAIDRLGDFVEFLDDNDSNAGKLIISLAALAAAVLALLVIIVELAPDVEPKELHIEQAGATTIVPADALRLRLEEALLTLPDVTAARARVTTKDRAIAAALELTVTPQSNLASVTQEANRVVIDTVQTDLGLPVAGVPTVKISFGGSRAPAAPASAGTADVVGEPSVSEVETVDERIAPPETADSDYTGQTEPTEAPPAQADSSPRPLVYEESAPPAEERTEETPGA
jgi:hypothetical protein